MRILLDEVQREIPANYCQWFSEMMLKFEDMVIRPLCVNIQKRKIWINSFKNKKENINIL